jgi:hypothetical protein
MIIRRQPCWRKLVALVAGYALMISALLPGLAPPAHGQANQLGQSVVMCLASGGAVTHDDAPSMPTERRHDACCVFCMATELAATSDGILVSAPEYPSSRSSPLTPRIALGAFGATEYLPVNPRAPPRFS